MIVEGGVIDVGYRSEIKLILSNQNLTKTLYIYQGNYVAQMVIHKILTKSMQEVPQLPDTSRGTSEFRSTNELLLADNYMSKIEQCNTGSTMTQDQKKQLLFILNSY